jgi:hypothetical protein
MPRNRRNEDDSVMNEPDLEEDYLDVDKPLSGQNYYCISFISPEKVLEQKDLFMFHHYEKSVNTRLATRLNESITELITKNEDKGTVDISDIIRLKKALEKTCKEEDVNFADFKNKFEDFKFRDEEKVGEEFDKHNNFRTSVRGVKVRGVFDTKREADVRAQVLQRMDPNFDVFVGQVGYWCPWDPNAQKIAEVEYLNKDLNNLMKEYKANEAKKDMFYNEQKAARQKDAISAEERLKHQEGLKKMVEYRNEQEQKRNEQMSLEGGSTNLINSFGTNLESLLNISEKNSGVDTNDLSEKAITESIQLGGEGSTVITMDEQTSQLEAVDPWLQRKLASSQ